MKKFLSLVLALVMTMSLVTISAGAKDFTDNDKITYDEAVAVISEIGVVDGDTNGSFRPTDTLTRQAAAKIICNLILGPTTASELHADTAPYRDVPANNQFAGYIAYCQSRGIISGYADGSFRPTGTLTGYAFMKMLLGALGYDSTLEGYVGANWSINVAKQALGIGLNKGLEGEFNGIKAVTREEACLYAFRTIQADLVEYGQRLTTTINGTEVTLSNGGAQSRKWTSQQSRINNIREDEIMQFAEEYFRKLEKKTGEDEFKRPAYTWIYDKEQIGTFVDWDLLVETYTKSVTGRDLYDLLGSALLNDDRMDLVYYVNGVQPENGAPLPSWVCKTDGSVDITKENGVIRRNNQEDVGITDRGVLTQVFVDKDVRESIIITSIDTWLAKANADYSESKENATIDIWNDEDTDAHLPKVVDVEDVPEIANVTEGSFYLLSMTFENDINGEVVEIWEPDILEESAITKFSTDVDGHVVPSKVTTGGTEYKQAKRGYYDPEALYQYDGSLLTDRTYNVILDQYGNLIGIELHEGAKNYIFITGFDRPQSNLAVKTADAAGILLDGTMQTIKVNVTDTDKNIKAVNKADADRGGATWAPVEAAEYFIPWQDITTNSAVNQNGFHALNRWFTYSVNKDGVYTLKPATKMIAYKSTDPEETIKTANLYLDDNVMHNASVNGDLTSPYFLVKQGPSGGSTIGTAFTAGASGAPQYPYTDANDVRVYGNDDSVYITVETGVVDTLTRSDGTISGVTGVYTGVQNIEIVLNKNDIENERPLDEAYVYAVYDRNNYIIGAVTVGEADGGDAIIAYVTGGVKSERIENGIYYWEFSAIVDGVEQTLTVKEKYGGVFGGSDLDKSAINNEASKLYKAVAKSLDRTLVDNTLHPISGANKTRNWNAADGLVELRKDADDYVVSIKPVAEADIYSYYGDKDAGAASVNFKGNNSYVDDTESSTYNAYSPLKDISKAKAYRIGTITPEVINGNVTWDYEASSGRYNHYDSAPEVLTLKGRTLYVTGDQHDEGLALTSDAKGVVIQRLNGEWKTYFFSNVSSAVAQAVDTDIYTSGKQFSGAVIAPVNSKGQAPWVVIIDYTNMTTSSGVVAPSASRVTNVAVQYVNPDAPTDDDTNDEYIAFVLYGTTPGKKYDVTIYTNLGGIQTERHKTVVGANGTNVTRCDTLAKGVYGKLIENTHITVVCEDGVGTETVQALASQSISCTLS